MIFLSALLGGILLNFMPCILPILGIKIKCMTQLEDKFGPYMYTAGSVIAFIIIGLLSTTLGWGFQLQSLHFNIFVCVSFFLAGLVTLGVLNIPRFILAPIYRFTSSPTTLGSFFSGFISPILASSCAAPFMAAAVFFALSSSMTDAIIIFGLLGLGLGIPYMIFHLLIKVFKINIKVINMGAFSMVLKYSIASMMFISSIWFGKVAFIQFQAAACGPVMQLEKPSREIKVNSMAEVEAALKEYDRSVILFTADWCQFCHIAHPRIQEAFLKRMAGVQILVVDLTSSSAAKTEISRKFGSKGPIPYLAYVYRGNLTDSILGAASIDAYLDVAGTAFND